MRTRIRRMVALVGLSALLFPGCAHVNSVMQSWEGHHYSNLMARWGPPQQVFDDGMGGRILVYTTNRSWVVPGTATTRTTFNATGYDNYIWGSATSRTIFTPAQVQGYTAYRMFWIDRSGHIYRWAWRGL